MSNTEPLRISVLESLQRLLDDWEGPRTASYWRLESEKTRLLVLTDHEYRWEEVMRAGHKAMLNQDPN